jgi:hypothetical protein
VRARARRRPLFRFLAAVPRSALLALLAALASAPGCLFVGGRARFGAPVSAQAAAAIVPGRTTKAELLARLGPPTEFKRPELGSVLVDDELRLSGVLAVARRSENALTWQYDRVAAAGTMLILFNRIASETSTDLLVVFFDEHDVVTTFAFRPAEQES